jgi:heat shock protein 5
LKFNHLLGKFDLAGIPLAPRGQPKIEVTFEVDSDGILKVTAEDKARGHAEKITITNDQGRLTKDQIEKMVQEAEENAMEDTRIKERIDAKNAFESYLYSMRSAMDGQGGKSGLGDKIESPERDQVQDALREGQAWLDVNPEAEAEDIREKQQEVERVCGPIVSKCHSGSGSTSGSRGGGEEDEEAAYDEL